MSQPLVGQPKSSNSSSLRQYQSLIDLNNNINNVRSFKSLNTDQYSDILRSSPPQNLQQNNKISKNSNRLQSYGQLALQPQNIQMYQDQSPIDNNNNEQLLKQNQELQNMIEKLKKNRKQTDYSGIQDNKSHIDQESDDENDYDQYEQMKIQEAKKKLNLMSQLKNLRQEINSLQKSQIDRNAQQKNPYQQQFIKQNPQFQAQAMFGNSQLYQPQYQQPYSPFQFQQPQQDPYYQYQQQNQLQLYQKMQQQQLAQQQQRQLPINNQKKGLESLLQELLYEKQLEQKYKNQVFNINKKNKRNSELLSDDGKDQDFVKPQKQYAYNQQQQNAQPQQNGKPSTNKKIGQGAKQNVDNKDDEYLNFLNENQNVVNNLPQLNQQSNQNNASQPQITKKKSLINERKQQLKKILKMWGLFFLIAYYFLIGYRRSQAKIRKLYQEEFSQKYLDASVLVIEWLKTCIEGPANALVRFAKEDFNIVNVNIQPKEMKKRTDQIVAICETFNQSILDNVTPTKISNDLFVFMANAFSEHCFLPQQVLFEFELNRLKFNPNQGFLVDQTPKKVEMLIAFFILIRIFIANVMVRPWDFLLNKNKLQDNVIMRQKLKIISSIFYITIMDMFQKELSEIPANQSQLIQDQKIQPQMQAIPIKFDDQELVQEVDGTRENVVIGLYSKEDLEPIYSQYQGWVEQFSNTLGKALMGFEQLVYSAYEKIQDKQNQDKLEIAKSNLFLIPVKYRK